MRRLLLLPFILLACREKAAQLVGAHDSPASAFVLEADRQVTGKLRSGESQVYFSVRLAEMSMFRAQLSAVRGADTRLEVLNSSGDLLHTANDHGSSIAEEIHPVFLAAGDYLLRLSATAELAEDFTLFYRLFKAPADVEREPNNTPETATAVTTTHASGFYGAEFSFSGKEKAREQDCFRFMAAAEGKSRAEFKLSGVDGYTTAIQIFDKAGEVLVAGESDKPGQLLSLGPLAVPKEGQLTACIRATRRQANVSRDYYDLEMRLSDVQLKSESEPNNSAQTAGEIAADSMEGGIATLSDADYFYWQNRRDYPVILRIELTAAVPQLLKLETVTGSATRVFEGSAEKVEVADNLRVEAGERVTLLVRCGKKCNRKSFKPVAYQLHLDESQATDENETEPNDNPDRAEALVDLTQKWGFINPPGDTDYYRLSLSQAAVRDVIVESKLGCRLRLEHLRGGKSLAISAGSGKVIYNAELLQGDLLRLQCAGDRPSADRSYRLSVNEP
ncbi:MAG: hypothetical protein ACOY5B_13555 [Spirochaetota bacterium]